jgi:hypothetical protein
MHGSIFGVDYTLISIVIGEFGSEGFGHFLGVGTIPGSPTNLATLIAVQLVNSVHATP